jgi:hypothetical protein
MNEYLVIVIDDSYRGFQSSVSYATVTKARTSFQAEIKITEEYVYEMLTKAEDLWQLEVLNSMRPITGELCSIYYQRVSNIFASMGFKIYAYALNKVDGLNTERIKNEL